MSYCVLLLFLTCRPARPLQMTLATAQAVGFFADSIQTREITIIQQSSGWPGPAEHDPITRPFVGAEPTGPRLFAFGFAAVTATSIVSDRMRRSHTWVRHMSHGRFVLEISKGLAAVRRGWDRPEPAPPA